MKRRQIFNELTNLIKLCETTIEEQDKTQNRDENIADIKNVLLPELVELRKNLETNINLKIHLNSVWYILDSWNYSSEIGKKVIEFSNKYK